MGEYILFTRQKKRFAVSNFEIQGVGETENGTVLVTDKWGRICIDEDFKTAYNRLNKLDEWNEGILKE